MSKPAIGARVGAVMSAKDGVAKLFGFGVYVGDEVPPDTGPASMTAWLHDAGIENPKLVLDDGGVVWGCECWWGSEEQIRRMLEDYPKVEVVSLAEARGIPTQERK